MGESKDVLRRFRYNREPDMAIKKYFFYFILVVLLLIFADVISSYFLFYFFALKGYERPNFSYKKDGWAPSVVVASKMYSGVVKRLAASEQCKSRAQPMFYHYDETYGYGRSPGRYIFTVCPNYRTPDPKKTYEWTATIDKDGARQTSHRKFENPKRIFLFGDSWIFGWAVNDEQAMAWLLQDYFQDRWTARNYAQPGGGLVQALIKYRLLRQQLTRDDILIFGYANYYSQRDVAAPSRISEEYLGLEQHTEPLKHPRGRVINGKVEVDFIPLSCQTPEKYCDQTDPPVEQMRSVTSGIFDEIIETSPSRLAVLYLSGSDNDSVVTHLKKKQIPIIDGRLDTSKSFTNDSIYGYDSHPGPFANYYWYTQIKKYIEK
jgi:hypothetical protein